MCTVKENAPENDEGYTHFVKTFATLFDTIGMLAPFTNRAQMMLQDICAAGLKWDEDMNNSLSMSTHAWFEDDFEVSLTARYQHYSFFLQLHYHNLTPIQKIIGGSSSGRFEYSITESNVLYQMIYRIEV